MLRCTSHFRTVLAAVAITIFCNAQAEDLLNLNLQDLMALKVSVASKQEESIYTAPSVIAIVTAEDIQRSGANNLLDVLTRQASIQTLGSSFIPNNVVSIRGQALQHENNHVLMLINGRPMRESGSGGNIRPLLEAFPLSAVEKIEIIRGPGSVLYGSNAYSGVISVVTKPAANLENLSVGATYGSFATRAMEASGGSAGQDWDFMVGAKSLRADGWSYRVTDAFGVPGSFDTQDADLGVVSTAHYKGLSFNTFYGSSEEMNLSTFATLPGRENEYRSWVVDLGYEHKLPRDWSLKYNLTHNYLKLVASDVYSHSTDFLHEVSVSGKATEKVDLLIGASYESLESAPLFQKSSATRKSGFLQADYSPTAQVSLIGGVQLNEAEGADANLSPRFAAIFDFNEYWVAKLMYGEAFRSPTILETHFILPGVITGNPNLEPETIATSEAQLIYHTHTLTLSLNAYHSEMHDLIRRVGFPIEFANAGTIEFEGVEFEGTALLPAGFSITGNLTAQRNEDELGRRESTYTPKNMAKLGISYFSQRGFTLNLFDSYFGEPTPIRNFQPVNELNPQPRAYHQLTFNANFDLNRLTGSTRFPQTQFSLFLDNLLDEDIRFPDINGGAINSVPIHSGRALYGNVTVRLGRRQ